MGNLLSLGEKEEDKEDKTAAVVPEEEERDAPAWVKAGGQAGGDEAEAVQKMIDAERLEGQESLKGHPPSKIDEFYRDLARIQKLYDTLRNSAGGDEKNARDRFAMRSQLRMERDKLLSRKKNGYYSIASPATTPRGGAIASDAICRDIASSDRPSAMTSSQGAVSRDVTSSGVGTGSRSSSTGASPQLLHVLFGEDGNADVQQWRHDYLGGNMEHTLDGYGTRCNWGSGGGEATGEMASVAASPRSPAMIEPTSPVSTPTAHVNPLPFGQAVLKNWSNPLKRMETPHS